MQEIAHLGNDRGWHQERFGGGLQQFQSTAMVAVSVVGSRHQNVGVDQDHVFAKTLEVVVDPLRQIGLGVNRASETQTPTAADPLGALGALGTPLVGANRHMETPARSDTVTAKLGQ